MARLLQFGSYTFPKGFMYQDFTSDQGIPNAELPRRPGATAQVGRMQAAHATVSGSFFLGQLGVTDIQTSLDDLRANLRTGKQNLFFRDDRYYRNAQLDHFSHSAVSGTEKRITNVLCSFYLEDPFQYGINPVTDTWNAPGNGGTRTIAINAGSADDTLAQFTVNLASINACSLTLTNSTTNKLFTLKGSPTGTSITVDCLAEAVYNTDDTDAMALFNGSFFPLISGNNTLTLTWDAGQLATINSLVTVWLPRWK